ncbi:THAP-type domain-containing protein, partial [Aphis craccivora]
ERSNVQLFKVCESEAHSWEEIVNKVNGNHKRKVTYVCVEHFRKEDLINSYSGCNDLEFKRNLIGLKKGVFPSVLLL